MRLRSVLSLALLTAGAVPAAAQDREPVAPVRHGISIGNYPNVSGLRFNYRDQDLQQVRGANFTIWSPYGEPTGTVRGLAFGAPLTGAGSINGIATGIFGVGASQEITGIAIAPAGIGAGGRLKGIMVGGVGVGTGGDLQGFALGGVGAGIGGNARGILIGGIGAGGTIDGIAIAGVGIGAPTIRKFAMASMVGANRMDGLIIAPALSRLEEGGSMRGVSVSAVNAMRGQQHGLTIGIVNYARELDGMQIGVVNIARNASVKFLPIVNYHKK